ncbi:MAG TPA: transcriptional repressor [Planctomycetota bacterium]|jgi:Fur family ferric uptake transcriptional regulator|nr:transcriptional repressor [Planctomycetota bacterium]OQC19072.1 MAG: Peroxide operon regulator [Planctomycetes bacterium ADurb.Bin069]HNS00262.1 transcriptional repressor [Planctomycetota bacterium]HNU27459.1 transcriptional repressor [Planctomycetota bacterium]HOE31006.1 transcriptional repressor [Planctomycetota bacterium]
MGRKRERAAGETGGAAGKTAWAAFEAFLAGGRARATRARRRVCLHVAGRRDHFRADDAAADLARGPERVSRGTVYRTLARLVEAGLLREIPAPDCTRYETIAGRPPHEHLLCEGCGRVVEAACGDLPGAVERMCAAQGFRARVYALRITGTCRQCAEKRR